jgi:hypothetical protein
MPRTRKHHLEFANFQCTAKNLGLLDLADDVVLPALLGGGSRKYGKTQYLIFNPAIVKVGVSHGVAFEFVKNTKLMREQIVRERKLLADRDELESAPSAYALLVFDDHRLIYLPKTSHAPTLRELEITCQTLFNQERLRHIDVKFKEGERAYGLRTQLLAALPPIAVRILPLASERSVGQVVRDMDLIKSFTVELVDTNTELEPVPWYRAFRDVQNALKGQRARVIHESKEGLAKNATVAQAAAAAKSGTVLVTLKGVDGQGENVTLSNEEMRVRVEASPELEEARTPRGAAPFMEIALKKLIQTAHVAAPEFGAKMKQRAKEVYDRWVGK